MTTFNPVTQGFWMRILVAVAIMFIVFNAVNATPFFRSNSMRDAFSRKAREVNSNNVNYPLKVASDSPSSSSANVNASSDLPPSASADPFASSLLTTTTAAASRPAVAPSATASGAEVSSTKAVQKSRPKRSEVMEWKQSSHMCFSRDHSKEAARHAACHYSMLCAASSTTDEKGDWFYLSDKEVPYVDFSSGIGPHHVDDRVFFPVKSLSLKEFRKRFPKARIESEPQFLFSEYNGQNYGHFLTDLLLPIYSVLEGFDALSTDIHLLHHRPKDPIGWSCDYQEKVSGQKARQQCDRFYASLIPMISQHNVTDLSTMLGPPGNAVCFNKLYVGASRFSAFCFDGGDSRGMQEGDPAWPNMPCFNGRQKQLWDFRMYTKTNLKIPDIPPRNHQVVIWDRRDTRPFNGLDLLAEKLRQNNISVFHVTDWTNYTIEDQIRMIGSTTVHVTGVGGGSFIALHLPRGATTIRLSVPATRFMESWVFDFLGYVHPVYATFEHGDVDVDLLYDHVSSGLKRYETFGVPFDY